MTLIGPFEEDGRETIQDIFNVDTAELMKIPIAKVKVEHGCTVTFSGGVENERYGDFLPVGGSASCLIVHETCYHLVKSFSRFIEGTLWDLFRRTNTAAFERPAATLFKGVDYLEISESHGQYVAPWIYVYGPEVEKAFRALSSAQDPEPLLRRLLLITAKCWVFVAPDRSVLPYGLRSA
jgi:hypothetical protein